MPSCPVKYHARVGMVCGIIKSGHGQDQIAEHAKRRNENYPFLISGSAPAIECGERFEPCWLISLAGCVERLRTRRGMGNESCDPIAAIVPVLMPSGL